MPSERFYVALYDSRNNELSFPFVQEKDALKTKKSCWLNRPLKKKAVLPDLLIESGENVLFANELSSQLKTKKISYWPGTLSYAWLGVPMKLGKEVIGALVSERLGENFSENDLRILATISRQTAIAIENIRLYDQLEHKVENLKILNQVGQQLTRGLAKQEKEILNLIYQSATTLGLDTRNMYIAFYDPNPDKPDKDDEIFGDIRFALAFDDGVRTNIPNRPARTGLTEFVIRTKTSYNPPDVNQAYPNQGQDQIAKIPLSWLGVPMLSEGKVFGVIVLRQNNRKLAYTQDDLELVEVFFLILLAVFSQY